MGLVLNLPPDSSSPLNAEEDVQEQTGRGQDCPEGADPHGSVHGSLESDEDGSVSSSQSKKGMNKPLEARCESMY